MRTTSRALGGAWTFREVGAAPVPNSEPGAWLPATVPGHVHLDLLCAGVIPDPFTGMHERTVQWVDHADWDYRCVFEAEADELAGGRQVLRFEGLDTVASVVLNDHELGTTDNMFVPHEFDVTGRLHPGPNTLEVRFASAEVVGEQRLAAATDLAPFRPEGARRPMSGRSMVRKAQYMWGWDWGPTLRSCGIWRPVDLVHVPVARATDWSWRATFDPHGGATVEVEVEVEGEATEVGVAITGHGADVRVAAPVVDGRATASLGLDEVRRWWCNGLGEPDLYDLTITVGAEPEVADVVSGRIGLRELELVREPDDAGESFSFRINGVPVFAKGANWIPDDSFPSRPSAERVEHLLRRAHECGMNMIRVWGGGFYESEEFYRACDELGLMVWQDFPFACTLYPDDDAAVAALVPEATAAARRLRNHPSLALWCGNNEVQWMTSRGIFGHDLPRVLGDRLFDDVLPAIVARHDPGRPYWPGSPWGSGDDPNGDHDGNVHYWDVWHGEGDWVHYTKCRGRFVSEFGFAAPPHERTLREALAPEHLGVDTPAMRWHDKTHRGYETYLGFIALHYPMPTTLPDLVYYGQLNQADAMRHGIEHLRRQRPHTMGALAWQLNDCWPVQSWSWIDHALRPKAAWYAAKRFFAPLLLSLVRDGAGVGVHLVNDTREPSTGTVVARVVDLDGEVLWHGTQAATIEPGASRCVADLELPPTVLAAAGRAIVHATFLDVEASLLLAEPKDLTLTTPRVTATTTARGDEVAVTLEADRLALSVMLWLDGVDAWWSDSFFHLLPGETRRVVVEPERPLTADEVSARLRWRAL